MASQRPSGIAAMTTTVKRAAFLHRPGKSPVSPVRRGRKPFSSPDGASPILAGREGFGEYLPFL